MMNVLIAMECAFEHFVLQPEQCIEEEKFVFMFSPISNGVTYSYTVRYK